VNIILTDAVIRGPAHSHRALRKGIPRSRFSSALNGVLRTSIRPPLNQRRHPFAHQIMAKMVSAKTLPQDGRIMLKCRLAARMTQARRPRQLSASADGCGRERSCATCWTKENHRLDMTQAWVRTDLWRIPARRVSLNGMVRGHGGPRGRARPTSLSSISREQNRTTLLTAEAPWKVPLQNGVNQCR